MFLPSDGPAVWSECAGFVLAPQIAGIWVYTGCGGIWRGIYQPLVPTGRGFYLGLARLKVCPRYSPDQGGQWLQLTGVLLVFVRCLSVRLLHFFRHIFK